MIITFKDKNLELVETERAAETRLPVPLIASLRHKLRFIRNTPDERSLREWKSLHYEKMANDERSIRINDQYRLIFTINTDRQPNEICVIRLWDHD